MSVAKLAEPAVNESVVGVLEDMLEQAKQGKLHEIAFCARGEAGTIWRYYGGNDCHVFTMYGGIMSLAADYRDANID